MLLLPTAFLPEPHFFALLTDAQCGIFVGEQYQKQSYRNRTNILAANGVVSFSIPVQKIGYPSPPTGTVTISQHGNWRHQLEHLLISSYTNAPYWFHYRPMILELVRDDSIHSLVIYNHLWMSLLCRSWGIDIPEIVTEIKDEDVFHPEVITPKYKENLPIPDRYWQVYEQKFGFTPHLSALDLLLNMGPEGSIYLKQLPKLITIHSHSSHSK